VSGDVARLAKKFDDRPGIAVSMMYTVGEAQTGATSPDVLTARIRLVTGMNMRHAVERERFYRYRFMNGGCSWSNHGGARSMTSVGGCVNCGWNVVIRRWTG
jgi:hypothetical protein